MRNLCNVVIFIAGYLQGTIKELGLSHTRRKSLNTKDTKYTKGKRSRILRAFFFVTFVFRKVFLLNTVGPE